MKLLDLTGKTFGKLKVIKRVKDHVQAGGQHKTTWLCICSCGRTKEFSVQGRSLKSGNTTQCEMCAYESRGKSNLRDLIGRNFGLLTVKELHHTKPIRCSFWLCMCECGNNVVVCGTELVEGNTSSCGCLRDSYMSYELKKYYKYKYNAFLEYKIVKNPDTNRWLPYDIYLPDKNVFIEIHGSQHYKLGTWHYLQADKNGTSPEEEFTYQKYKDKVKKRFARKNGIYVEIDLRKVKTPTDAINYIKNSIL